MKNLKSNTMKLGMLTLFLVSSSFAQMHDGGHRDMGMPGKHMPILSKAEELGLNDKQVTDLKNIHHDFLKKSIETEARLKILELDFKKSMMDDATEKELKKQADNIASKMAEMRKLHISMHFKVRNTLTKEQWNKWKKERHGGMMKKKMMKKGKEHMKHMEM